MTRPTYDYPAEVFTDLWLKTKNRPCPLVPGLLLILTTKAYVLRSSTYILRSSTYILYLIPTVAV
jgi:hypothetical protein